ncbi:MAG: type IV pilus assembly protein PilM [Peptococcaceae bacterium]|nr:MAG: type IV pilus assembly protein PilM [Peptococcaceae bacterium]
MKGFLRNLLPRKDICTAVDLGTSAIKVAEVRLQDGRPRIAALGAVPTPPDFAAGNLDSEEVAAALREALEISGAEGRDCVTGITGQKVITRHIRMPVIPEKELAKAVRWEAEKFIPVSLEESTIKYVKLAEELSDGEARSHLLLIAVPTELTYRYFDLFKRAGMHLAAIDLYPLAIFRAYNSLVNSSIGSETVAVVHFGANTSQFVLHRESRLLYNRTMPVGGNLITEMLARNLGVEYAEAEKVKLAGAGPEVLDEVAAAAGTMRGQVDLALQEGSGDLVREIIRSLEFYRSQEKALPVDKIIVSGGVSKMRGIVSVLEKELDLPVAVGSLGSPVDDDLGTDVIDNVYAAAVGLALREVDF